MKKTIAIQNLSKAFGDHLILNSFDAEFYPPERCCLMGPSGIGKTTLFRILLGLEKADSGTVTGLDGLRSSAVFQEDRLCESFSPIQNIRMVLKGSWSDKKIAEELSLLLPKECLTRPVFTLSGGMKRRVAICRSLIVPSDIVIMDEPFTGLDEATKRTAISYIKSRTEQRFLLLSTHQPEDARLLDARLITMGPHVLQKTDN